MAVRARKMRQISLLRVRILEILRFCGPLLVYSSAGFSRICISFAGQGGNKKTAQVSTAGAD